MGLWDVNDLPVHAALDGFEAPNEEVLAYEQILHEEHERKSKENQGQGHDGGEWENEKCGQKQKMRDGQGMEQFSFHQTLFCWWQAQVASDVVKVLRKG
jgi:hypothetical protein